MLKKNLKLFRDKKAVNDVSIIASIITIFVLIGVLLPFVNDAFDNQGSDINVDSIQSNVGDDVENLSAVNAFTVLFSVLKMFFWTFGDLPFWLDAVFLILRITLAIIIARNIWIGGGA